MTDNISPLVSVLPFFQERDLQMHKVVTGLTQRIIRTKHSLIEALREELGELKEPDYVTNQLLALIILQEGDMQDFLNLYLNARKVIIV